MSALHAGLLCAVRTTAHLALRKHLRYADPFPISDGGMHILTGTLRAAHQRGCSVYRAAESWGESGGNYFHEWPGNLQFPCAHISISTQLHVQLS